MMKIRLANLDDCAGLAKVQVDSYLKTYARIFPPAYLEHFTYAEQEQDWRELLSGDFKDILFVAGNDIGEIAGYALGKENSGEMPSYESELVSLHVRGEYQRQGIGRQLISATCGTLKERGYRSLFLWVVAENPARAFYENLGGVQIGEKPWGGNAHFGLNVCEVASGWPNIESLIFSESRTSFA